MHHRVMALVAATVAVLSVVFVTSSAAAGGRPLMTTLSGAAEVPGPGDPDATGSVSITLNQGQGQVCYDLSWENIDGTVTDAHVHLGTPDVAGDVVVPLFVGQMFAGTGSASDCASDVDKALVKAIRKDSGSYYVNVHSDVFPAGAIRGQLTT